MANNDPQELYAAGRAGLIGQLRSLTTEESETIVAACPDWTVRNVAAHVSGLVAEALANVPPPYGSPEATARQVNDRANNTLAEICDEWEANGPGFAEYASSNPAFLTALIADLTVHSHDIAETLDLPIDEDSPAVVYAVERYIELLQARVAEQLDIALTIELAGVGSRPASAGSKPLALTVAPFVLLRCVTGRRTRDKIRALEWTGDPTEVISKSFYQYHPAN